MFGFLRKFFSNSGYSDQRYNFDPNYTTNAARPVADIPGSPLLTPRQTDSVRKVTKKSAKKATSKKSKSSSDNSDSTLLVAIDNTPYVSESSYSSPVSTPEPAGFTGGGGGFGGGGAGGSWDSPSSSSSYDSGSSSSYDSGGSCGGGDSGGGGGGCD